MTIIEIGSLTTSDYDELYRSFNEILPLTAEINKLIISFFEEVEEEGYIESASSDGREEVIDLTKCDFRLFSPDSSSIRSYYDETQTLPSASDEEQADSGDETLSRKSFDAAQDTNSVANNLLKPHS